MRAIPLTLCLVMLCAGCAAPSAPLPPSLGIPKPVADLKAVRKGDTVTLTWSAPTDTTDGALVRKPGKMRLSRTLAGKTEIVAEMALPPALKDEDTAPPTVKDSLTGVLQSPVAAFAGYSVQAESNTGKTA